MSKAIKTAVSKWGVALNLDEEQPHDVGGFPYTMVTPQNSVEPMYDKAPPMTAPIVQAPPSMQPPVSIPIEEPAKPVFNGPPIMGMPMAPVSQTPVTQRVETFGPPMSGSAPTMSINKPTINTGISQPPIFMAENSGANSNHFDVGVGVQDDVVKITSVQKVAVEQIMTLNNYSFSDLLNVALQRANDLPASLDDVSYLDAVKLIQYGNHLRKL
jgi:hypothetical protein